MGWENVPWMVGGGALHQAEVGRLLAYAATSGNEGLVGVDDLKVSAFAAPGAGITISPGAAVIPCRAAGQTYQSYVGRMPSQDTVGVAGTGSVARTDMIIGRVEDPWLSGEPWNDPAVGQESIGPYIYSRLISVPASAILNYEAARAYLAANAMSAVPLGGVTQPINNAVITQNMIIDLRRVANPRRLRQMFTNTPAAKSSLTSATQSNWGGAWNVSIPTWATRAVITGTVSGVKLDRQDTSNNGTASGKLRVGLSAVTGQDISYDEFAPKADGSRRLSLNLGDTLTIPAADRGTLKVLSLQANKTGGNQSLYVDSSSFSTVDIEFQEVAG